jgi:hypothetical protein
MSLPPLSTDLPAEALRVLAQATALRTPCGDGETVWHSWGDGEPLVLLHGGSGSWTHWLRNVQALAGARAPKVKKTQHKTPQGGDRIPGGGPETRGGR